MCAHAYKYKNLIYNYGLHEKFISIIDQTQIISLVYLNFSYVQMLYVHF